MKETNGDEVPLQRAQRIITGAVQRLRCVKDEGEAVQIDAEEAKGKEGGGGGEATGGGGGGGEKAATDQRQSEETLSIPTLSDESLR